MNPNFLVTDVPTLKITNRITVFYISMKYYQTFIFLNTSVPLLSAQKSQVWFLKELTARNKQYWYDFIMVEISNKPAKKPYANDQIGFKTGFIGFSSFFITLTLIKVVSIVYYQGFNSQVFWYQRQYELSGSCWA